MSSSKQLKTCVWAVGGFLLLMSSACENKTPLKSVEYLSQPYQPRHFSLNIKGYCPLSDRRFSELIAVNESMRIEKGQIEPDWDRDGLSNNTDNTEVFNIDFRQADTNSDGYSDLLMYFAGVKASAQDGLRYCQDPQVDTDSDGLNDCEERYLATNEASFDTDGDMLPDRLEILFGLDPQDPFDVYQDPDNDGWSNLEEVKFNTPVMESNTQQVDMLALRYDTTSIGQCFDFSISNIPVVNVSNGNLIRVYLIEQVKGEGGLGDDKAASYFTMETFSGVVERTINDGEEIEIDFEKRGEPWRI